MKKYKFEFDKFVKDLEERSDRHRQRLEEEVGDYNEQEIKRDKARRYHEHPHNTIVYKKAIKNDKRD